MNALSNEKSLYYINNVKTFGIITVLLGHLTIPQGLASFVNAFHMPLFFFISGYLFSVKDYSLKEFTIHKARTLLIPFLFLGFITFLFWPVKEQFNKEIIEENLLNYLIGFIYAPASKEFLGFNIPLWFLPSLFLTEIIMFLMIRYIKRYLFLFSCLLFGIGIILNETVHFRLPWGLDTSCFSVIFLYLGYVVRKKDILNKYLLEKGLLIKLAMLFISLASTILFIWLNEIDTAVSYYSLYYNNYAFFLLAALSGILFSFCLDILIPSSWILNFYGRNTIVLLGLHLMVFAILKAMQVFILRIPLTVLDDNVSYNLVYILLTMILLAPVIIIINKYIPFVLGRKKAILQ